MYVHRIWVTLWGRGQLFWVWQFVFFSLGFVILVLHYINNMKTILAGNAIAFFKNQINNMRNKSALIVIGICTTFTCFQTFLPLDLIVRKKITSVQPFNLTVRNKIASVQLFNRSLPNGLSSRFLSVLLPCVQQFENVFAWEVTFQIMSIAVMISLVVSVSESGKRGLFWIVYNNYSTKALLNSFELYLSIITASKK